MKNKVKNYYNKEHDGFVITLEVMVTMVMMFVFIIMILYFVRVMEVQRYFSTVLTSTAVAASRWGGVDSESYKKNISSNPGDSLLVKTNKQLSEIAVDYSAFIYGNPKNIQNNGEEITIAIQYSLPPVFSTMSTVTGDEGSQVDMYSLTKNMSMSIKVKSTTRSGILLKGE